MLCVRFFSLFVPESFLGLIDFIVPHPQSFEFVLCCVCVCLWFFCTRICVRVHWLHRGTPLVLCVCDFCLFLCLPETISGFIDFIVAPTLGVCGDVISLVAGRYFNFALQSLTLYLGEATAWRIAKSDFESQHLLCSWYKYFVDNLPCVILWLLILSEGTRRSPGRRTWQWTKTCGKRR